MSISSRRLQVNGITLNVVVEGSGPDVLLVHGFPDDHSVWRKQIPALVAAGYRVIAPDMRGCGESDMPPATRDYAVANLVADLVGVLDALGIDQVKLVGHDWGAVICWQLCIGHPQRVERYAALSVGHPTAYARAPLEQKLKGYYILLLQLRGLAEAGLRARDWALFRRLMDYPEAAQHCIVPLRRPGRLRAAINYYRANLHLILPTIFPSVTMPVMGVYSSGDNFLCEQQMRATENYVSGPWRYEQVTGANHWLQLDAPECVNALLLDFLRQEQKAGSTCDRRRA
ncbi:MAG: alpha/beta fold hydrolase [Pseudomonadota bacterium]